MIKIKEAIIVEGKYDKIKLENIIDALIIETNGFSIHKDKERLKLIKQLAAQRGVLIFTDSDHAGFQIRSYLTSALPAQQVKHAYIPDVWGKERRKDKPSKEGKLGVEGVDTNLIIAALEKSGVLYETQMDERKTVTNADLYNDGFSGTSGSKKKKQQLLRLLDLPEFLSTNSFLKLINTSMGYDEYKEAVARLDKE